MLAAKQMPRIGLTIEEIQLALGMWAKGKDTQQIAAAIGVSEATIYNRIANWRRAYGVPAQ